MYIPFLECLRRSICFKIPIRPNIYIYLLCIFVCGEFECGAWVYLFSHLSAEKKTNEKNTYTHTHWHTHKGAKRYSHTYNQQTRQTEGQKEEERTFSLETYYKCAHKVHIYRKRDQNFTLEKEKNAMCSVDPYFAILLVLSLSSCHC